jgi:hypothetical protein
VTEKGTGKPISKATVHLGWSDLLSDSTADSSGRAIVQPLTAERWFVECWGEGWAKESQWVNLESGADVEIDFQLVPGATIEGTVRDPEKMPVEQVGISVSVEGKNEQLDYVKSDRQGRYRLEHVPLGATVSLWFSKNEFMRDKVAVRAAEARNTLDLTIAPRPHGGSITGIVVDEEGKPIADAELVNTGRSSDEVRESQSAKDGRFRLENLYEGSTGIEVIVRAKKFAPRRLNVEPGPADDPAEVKITLERGHRIVGRVTDERQKPLEGVSVYFANGNHPFSIGGKTTTDKGGRFELDSLPLDSPFTFNKNGYSEITNHQLPLDGDDVVEVEMITSGVVLGKVIDAATEKPIASFNVRITFSPKRQPNEPSPGLRSDLIDPGQAFQAQDGTFRLRDLVVGMPLQVMVDAEGYERGIVERAVVERPDEAEAIEFRLAAIDTALLHTYRGKLLNAKGKPVAGAQLRLIVARDRAPQRRQFPFNWEMIRSGQIRQMAQIVRFLEGKTDREGRFEFPRVPHDAEVELAWWGEKIASGRSDHLELLADEDREQIEIRLPKPARIVVTIDREAYPHAGYLSIVSNDLTTEGRNLELKRDQTSVEIDDLEPGRYAIFLATPFERVPGQGAGLTNKQLASTKIDLEEGQTQEVEFTGE